MNAPDVITFGCRLNAYESEVMRGHALATGLDNAIIVNTCAVTAEAERQARQSIRRLRRERPDARIIVTGCAAHIDPAKFSEMPEVDFVMGNDRKMEAGVFAELNRSLALAEPTPPLTPPARGGERLRPEMEETSTQILTLNIIPAIDIRVPSRLRGRIGEGLVRQEPISKIENHPTRTEGDLQRAFVQIQNGCDHRCTFCIIPYGRGASRSVPIGAVAEQTRAMVEQGYREVVFTGVDIASYGGDLPGKPNLGQMIRRVLAQVPELPRLRLSSLDPAAVDENLWRLIAEEPRFMPHLHLSLQAGDDMILKRMKRRHLRADILALCERARCLRPDIVFGADVIAGFPTETDAMFQNTYDLIEQCGFTWLHVFPYSARKGTPAAKMPQINGALRRERADRLRSLGAKAAAKHMAELVGLKFDILVEQQGLGCTRQFAKVKLIDEAPLGQIIPVACFACESNQALVRRI